MKGVPETEVAAVDGRDVADVAENGVYGDGLRYGEFSSILALFGGTSGGKVLDLSRLSDNWCVSLGTGVELDGMTSGAKIFGDSGCLGGDAILEVFWLFPALV